MHQKTPLTGLRTCFGLIPKSLVVICDGLKGLKIDMSVGRKTHSVDQSLPSINFPNSFFLGSKKVLGDRLVPWSTETDLDLNNQTCHCAWVKLLILVSRVMEGFTPVNRSSKSINKWLWIQFCTYKEKKGGFFKEISCRIVKLMPQAFIHPSTPL